ncbi:MAG: SUMF1/EgtB/PvdO family nonheme iron enzyme, partial [Bacteroidota bacterium]
NIWYNLRERRYEPITLIDYKQAKNYCEWRSNVVSEKLGVEVIYRLPTPREWEMIAHEIWKKKEGRQIRSLSRLRKYLLKADESYYLQSREYPKNLVYDLFSNVSEMTATKGIAKGGSNFVLLKQESLKTDVKYRQPNKYLGFRCVAEIKRTNDR